jgi:hypothetical protein
MSQILGITVKILRSGRFSALVALAGLGLLLSASGARAQGCAVAFKTGAAHAISAVTAHADDRPEAEDLIGHASIVGLWHLNYTAEAESGAPIFPPAPFAFLESFKTWHADGTEFENAFLPPTGGNICFGVWKDLGNGWVKLHHIGIMFAADGSVSNLFTVDEKDRVAANGSSYSGNFDFKLWPPTFAAIGVGTPIAEVTGTTAATRIGVD